MIDIVIPVYNEAENILRCLSLIADKVTIPYQVTIVYDFDEDTTLQTLGSPAGLALRQRLPAVNLKKNQYGRGALTALKTGLLSSDCDYVIVTMADLSDPPEVMNDMWQKATRENLDIVCGSRYMPGGRQIGGPLLKRTLSRLAGLSLRYLVRFPTHDVTNSFKLYKSYIFKSLTLESHGGFEIGMEIVVKAWINGYKIGETPTSWQDRSAGDSTFKLWQWLPNYLNWWLMAATKPRKKKSIASI